MKKIFTSTILIFIFLINGYAQKDSYVPDINEDCSFNDLFPFKYGNGITEFEALKLLNLNKNFYAVKKCGFPEGCVNFKYKPRPCLKGHDTWGVVNFRNDKLGNMRIYATFNSTELAICIANMEELVTNLKESFPYIEKQEVFREEEKIGEGYSLCTVEDPFGKKVSYYEEIVITYTIRDKYDVTIINKGGIYKTGEIDYEMEINYSRRNKSKTEDTYENLGDE